MVFSEKVGEMLIEAYGRDNVEKEKYFSESKRYVDYWVSGPLVNLAVEVENDKPSLMVGAGQAIMYSGHSENTVPVVVVPEGHVEYPEVEHIRRYVPVVEL